MVSATNQASNGEAMSDTQDQALPEEDLQPADDEVQGETPAPAGDGEEVAASTGSDDADGELQITLGDEPESTDGQEQSQEGAESAPDWVKNLRKSNREKDRRIRDLENQIKAQQQPEQAIVVGEKPTMAACDYDEEKYEQELDAWKERKRAAESAAAEKEQAKKREVEAFQSRLDSYNAAKSKLRVADFADAEDAVTSIFSVTQQGILVNGCEKPAEMVYALGKASAKAKELADIKDPVKFAFALAKLETQLKVSNRPKAPPPEKRVTGNVSVTQSADQTLEKLREEAQRTGDASKLIQHKRELRRAKAA